MTTRLTAAFQATAFILATLAATCLLVAAGLAEEDQLVGVRTPATSVPHEPARATP